MKKLILIASLSVFGLSSLSAKTQITKAKVGSPKMITTCYKYVYDSHGHIIGRVQVKCPDVIVF